MSAEKKMKSSVQVLISGLPGNMGQEIAAACLRANLEVVPFALTGPGMPSETDVSDQEGGAAQTIKLLTVGEESELKIKEAIEAAEKAGKTLIAIDFTHPTAVNKNAELFAKVKLPFVMGTTGGDRPKLYKTVEDAGIYALIAPNMCKQIVALQAALKTMAESYPGAFGTYNLDITESHQSGKADTSGTAKALLESFNTLKAGEPLKVEEIKKLREREDQLAFGVPEDSLKGHAWHTYSLTSADGSVNFQFKHNVNGRRTYAEGVVDAVHFLAAKMAEGSSKKIFDMIDVLKSGQMR
mmetsp:Transcript_17305/g.19690  ORF Transcript_17305/g.19690 Transcript_17305/m.19690 type:complete len:297 (-) Transcript_17305:498-1388(-)|eukprot:CAMPEP_0184010794 /NCGR_PEP_ID=MMETSP0954-20121128/3434_1 /TAXON_ID=627963 /ORGANISM="Aplanochytrium sp, Strain PBS07" /LENGTH=296 /DNA_ID=CAMNT_0026290469 /DNA_START=83 /DNA_END=973 /DNA_ORIENTATION=+